MHVSFHCSVFCGKGTVGAFAGRVPHVTVKGVSDTRGNYSGILGIATKGCSGVFL